MYLVCPRPWVRASGRVVRWPTAGVCRLGSATCTSSGNGTSGAGAGARSSSSVSSTVPVLVLVSMGFLRDLLDRLDHLAVTGAAAQVAGERVANLGHRRVRVLVEQPLGGHDHAGAAEAALQRPLVLERLLNRMEAIGGREPFDGEHVATVDLSREHQARVHDIPVDDDGAGAAVADVAAKLRASQVEAFTQQP